MHVLKLMIAVFLCASAAYAEPGAGVSTPDNVTRQKITTEKIYAQTVTASNFIMPIIGSRLAETDEAKVVGQVSIEAFDNSFYDTSIPPRLMPNPMLELGVNVEKGNRKKEGMPAIWQGMETSYQTTSLNPPAGSRAYSEWYVSGVQSDGTMFRPFGFGWDTDNHTKYARLDVFVGLNQGFFITREDKDQTPLFSFTGTGLATLPSVQVSSDLAVGGSAAFGTQLWVIPSRAHFSPCGLLTLEGYARVRKTLVIPVSRAAPGVISPALAQRAVGASGGIKVPVLSFSNTAEQSVYVEIYAPLDLDDSADVELHALWQPAAGWSRGNCVWKFEYLVKDETGDFTAGTPVIISSEARPSNARDMQKAIFSTRLDVNTRQVILGRFYRDVASDDGDAAAELRCLKIEYTANKLGAAY